MIEEPTISRWICDKCKHSALVDTALGDYDTCDYLICPKCSQMELIIPRDELSGRYCIAGDEEEPVECPTDDQIREHGVEAEIIEVQKKRKGAK